MACGGGRMEVELEGLRTGKGFQGLGRNGCGGGSAKGVEGTVKVEGRAAAEDSL